MQDMSQIHFLVTRLLGQATIVHKKHVLCEQ